MRRASSVLPARLPLRPEGRVAKRALPLRAELVIGVFWLMIWAGYNTDISRLSAPDFPTGALDWFHGVRCLFPLVIAFLATLRLFARRPVLFWPLQGPLGLIALYGMIGLISSLLLSPEPSISVYWAGEYLGVILVTWSVLAGPCPIERASRLIKLNWAVIALLAAGLVAAIVLDPRVHLNPGGLLEANRAATSDQIYGMPSSRSTGVARYAAITGLLALSRISGSGWVLRIMSSLILLGCLSGIIYLQARTALLGLLAGAFALLWLRRSSRPMLYIALFVSAVLLAATGAYGAFWDWFTKGQAFDPTLTGRTQAWEQGWTLFRDSPFLGSGFLSDRLSLEGRFMENAPLEALVQAGLFGTLPFVAGLIFAWHLIYRLYMVPSARSSLKLPAEVPGIIAFYTVASLTDSTFALYGVAWILVAPCLGYLQAVMHQRQMSQLHESLRASPPLPLRQPGLAARSSGGA